jgi:hypothetical protein
MGYPRSVCLSATLAQKKVDRANQLVRLKLAVGKELDFGTEVIGSPAACFGDQAPMRGDAQSQAERRLRAI